VNFYLNKIENNPDELRVIGMNDLHFGSEAIDLGLLNRIATNIDRNRHNTRILINGDIIEGVTKQSKGDLYEQKLSPREQIQMAADYFMPYKDLIDCVVSGNHDQRIQNETSLDPVEIFCEKLGIESKYAGVEALVSYSFRKKLYTIQMFHGAGGGSTLAAIENNMKKYKAKTNAQVMYCGHWHKEFTKPLRYFAADPFNKVVREEKHYLFCGNACVNTAKYAKKAGYEENFPSQGVITLSGRTKDIDIAWLR
jgi:UDP-2,3-diacylglucosamine pyrophosphatase LpxH